MAAMTVVKGKYKYMPLSEANVKPVMVAAFDGQNIYVHGSGAASAPSLPPVMGSSFLASPVAEPKLEVRYCMGNYLGGGIAGVVNEAYDKQHQRNVAIKMLNPVGYKLSAPTVLRRGEIIKKGLPVTGHLRHLSLDHVFWVKLPGKRELVACYADARHLPTGTLASAGVAPHMLRELTLEMCVALWQLDAEDDEDGLRSVESSVASQPQHSPCEESKGSAGSSTSSSLSNSPRSRNEDDDELMMLLMSRDNEVPVMRDEQVTVGDVTYTIPTIPAKYRAFLESRKSIYREIAHMHKLTGNSVSGRVAHGGHPNVLKLFDVLEYIQPSKSTIFLVLELASGGELFDRIRSDNGVDEQVARNYFMQLLSGVLFCHQLGIVHRDLKPENLLLSDSDVLKIADFGLSAHFIAAVSSGGGVGVSASAEDDGSYGSAVPELDNDDDLSNSSLMFPAAKFRRLNSIVGSPHYVAPEVLQNARYGYDGRKADTWSVGVILYGLLAGSLPFGKDLPTCPRYLKFCEWIRSLPCDPQTGKLVFDASIYQPAATIRIPSSSTSSSTSTYSDPILGRRAATPTDGSVGPVRLAQVYPNCQPASSGSTTWWVHPNSTPVKPTDAAANVLPNGAPSGRRGSRVVAFPSWLFPSKLSPQAVFLMASLLHPEPGKRSSCEDACRALWLTDLSL